MKIKKFVGETSHEAMQKLKFELGSDAVVLSTKTIRRKGIFKYFRKPLIEITAAYEDKKSSFNNRKNFNNDNKMEGINKDISEIKESIKNLSKNSEIFKFKSPVLKKYNDILISNGVNSNISSEMLKKIEDDIDLENKDEKTIEKIIKYSLREALGKPEKINFDSNKKIYFFVGATGVGKTTTLAKIASNLVLEKGKDIGLITSDTYRIAAVEQLKIYSNILQLPLEIAYNKDDMIKAINKFISKDIILIDTAGRNHNDLEQIQELDNILTVSDNKDTFLLVNSSLEYKLMEDLIKKYEFLDDYKLIITKIDETHKYGSILNAKYLSGREIAYYTTGQNVPDDIKILDTENIVKELIEEKKDE